MATKAIFKMDFATLAAIAQLLLAVMDGPAQTPSTPAAQLGGFSADGYHPEPNHTRLKFRIKGATAQPEAGNRFRITQMQLATFSLTGAREMAISAPDCVYDPTTRTASSPGRFDLQSGDGRFSVGGLGYLILLDRESTLTISNEVRSVIHRTTNAAPDEPRLPLIITSRQFEFDMAAYRGVYRQQVRGDDPEMEFSCEVLSATATTNNQSFDVLTAETNVTLLNKKDGLRATADRADYTRADERMVLTGNTSWKQGRQEGRADRATYDRREESLEASGNVAMKVPRESLSAGGFFLTSTNTPPTIATNDSPLVDLFAAKFQYFPARSNLTVADGDVKIVDSTNQLTCDKLVVQTTAPSEQTTLAEGNVIVTRGNQGQGIRSDRAVYTKADDHIVFTGQPTWKLDQSDGRAERVTIHNSTRAVHAEGNVSTKVTVGEQQGTLLKLFPEPGDTNQGPRVIEVFARELNAKDRQVIFSGDARAHQSPITGSEPRLRSDTFAVQFGTNSNVEVLRAIENVVCEQGTPGITNGPGAYRKLTARTLTARTDPATGSLSDLVAENTVRIEQSGSLATGERATYAATTDIFEVTGQPTLETSQLTITDARTLVWDKTRNRFSATAPYTIRLRAETLKESFDKPKAR